MAGGINGGRSTRREMQAGSRKKRHRLQVNDFVLPITFDFSVKDVELSRVFYDEAPRLWTDEKVP